MNLFQTFDNNGLRLVSDTLQYWEIMKASILPGKRKKIAIGFLFLSLVILVAILQNPVAQYFYLRPSEISARNKKVGDALRYHPTSIVVGDTARLESLMGANALSQNTKILNVKNCTTPDSSAHNTASQTDLVGKSFSYILTHDQLLRNASTCRLDQIVGAFGKPNASSLIAGNIEDPTESILYYDHGISKTYDKAAASTSAPPSTVVPTPLDALKDADCPGATTEMNIVAHEDDDLLFMTPDLLHQIRAGNCIRTIYLTAGDGGNGSYYWLKREDGSEHAYSFMTPEPDDTWTKQIVKLGEDEYARIASPRSNPRISLIFLRLPDGNLQGQGFITNHNESLTRLERGRLASLHTVDGQSAYSLAQLSAALVKLMNHYSPALVRTQSTQQYIKEFPYSDHADHVAVGRLVTSIFPSYNNFASSKLSFYLGYTVRAFPANISEPDFSDVEATFLQYAQEDGAVCQTVVACNNSGTYGSYLGRQYQVSH